MIPSVALSTIITVKLKTTILFLLLVLIPIGLVSWFGWRTLKSEQMVNEYQSQKLAESQLQQIDSQVSGFFLELESLLLQESSTLAQVADNPQTLREFLRSSIWVEQVFVLESTGERLFPPPRNEASLQEQVLIDSLSDLWTDPNAFRNVDSNDELEVDDSNVASTGRVGKLADNLVVSKAEIARQKVAAEPPATVNAESSPTLAASPSAEIASADEDVFREQKIQVVSEPALEAELLQSSDYGWTLWQLGLETRYLFWLRDTQQRLVGLQLDRVQLFAQLIGLLPDQQLAAANYQQAGVRIIDNHEEVIYQFGNYTINNEQGLVSRLPMSAPLNGWRLEYYSNELNSGQRSRALLTALLILLTSLALIGLAIYLYREYTRANRLAQQRVNFVNQVSHELKTPLTNIRMYAELMEDQLLDDEEKPRQYLTVITNESQRLSRLISNVLSFSRSESQKKRIHQTLGCVDDCLRNVLHTFEPALHAKGIKVTTDLQAGRAVHFDHDVLEQVFNNLLSNIEKYAGSSSEVAIYSTQKQALVTITVKDNGPGIPDAEHERIFEAFYRVSSKLSDGVSGTGIGLPIARELCRLHGGDLRLIPQLVGACFQISLQSTEEKT